MLRGGLHNFVTTGEQRLSVEGDKLTISHHCLQANEHDQFWPTRSLLQQATSEFVTDPPSTTSPTAAAAEVSN